MAKKLKFPLWIFNFEQPLVTVNYRIYLNILAVSKKLLTCDKAKKKFENRKSFFELPAVKKNAYFQSEISLYKSNLGEWIALTDWAQIRIMVILQTLAILYLNAPEVSKLCSCAALICIVQWRAKVKSL